MIIGNQNDGQLKNKRRVATKFNLISFKNYDGTTTLKVVTRDQFNRITGKA
jgi:hypothetical protein